MEHCRLFRRRGWRRLAAANPPHPSLRPLRPQRAPTCPALASKERIRTRTARARGLGACERCAASAQPAQLRGRHLLPPPRACPPSPPQPALRQRARSHPQVQDDAVPPVSARVVARSRARRARKSGRWRGAFRHVCRRARAPAADLPRCPRSVRPPPQLLFRFCRADWLPEVPVVAPPRAACVRGAVSLCALE